jgi:hypothetical protein
VQGAQQAPAHEQDAHAAALDTILAAHATQDVDDDLDADEEQDAAEQDERKLNALLRKAERAFCKGNKHLLLSRVECGKHCHDIYVLRQTEGHKDRGFTSTLIFNRLAVHADSKRERDATDLAHMYKTVELLAPAITGKDAPWKSLTVGKLLLLKKLVKRADGTELYGVLDKAKEEQCKALFVWACGEGLKQPSIQDIDARVLELLDPTKYAAKQAEKAAKEAEKKADATQDAASEDEEEEETPAPENLISTDAARPAAPDWKDVPEGMSAQYNEAMRQAPQEMEMVREALVAKLAKLPVADVVGWMIAFFQEGCKRNVGKSHEMLAGFAKQLVWTNPMVKGLLDGLADSQDADSAQEALQTIVDTIGDEYGIFPQSELETEKEQAA